MDISSASAASVPVTVTGTNGPEAAAPAVEAEVEEEEFGLGPWIDEETCKRCGKCKGNCPSDAIEGERETEYRIIPERCTKCGVCRDVCPFDAVGKVPGFRAQGSGFR